MRVPVACSRVCTGRACDRTACVRYASSSGWGQSEEQRAWTAWRVCCFVLSLNQCWSKLVPISFIHFFWFCAFVQFSSILIYFEMCLGPSLTRLPVWEPMYVSFIGLRLPKTRLTLINRTRLRTKGQSAGYPQAQIGITSKSFQRRAP